MLKINYSFKNFILFLGFALIILNINIANAQQQVVASFTMNINYATRTVTFTNTSTGPIDKCFWSFGDAVTLTTTTVSNQTHTYAADGKYPIMLGVTNINSSLPSSYKIDSVQFGNPIECYAAFSYLVYADSNLCGFANNSMNYTAVQWDFGDGNISTTNSNMLTHVYNQQGFYTVCLTVRNNSTNCIKKICKDINVGEDANACNANFSYNNTSGNTVNFTNTSTSSIAPVYRWFFGDGKTSDQISPSHTYTYPGIYIVRLTLLRALPTLCSDVHSEVIFVGNYQNDCEADFESVVGSDSTVYFSDKSIGTNLTNKVWNFGDMSPTVNNQSNVSHKYNSSGFFNVCLTVSNSSNSCYNTSCRIIKVGDDEACNADFSYSVDNKTVSFADLSVGSAVNAYNWNFGDAKSSTSKNPIHTYTNNGIYLVMHNIVGSNCLDFDAKLVNVGLDTVTFMGQFGFLIGHTKSDEKAPAVPVDFKGASIGDPAIYRYNFGDGSPVETSTETPVHYFTAGTWNVTLTVEDPVTNQSNVYTKTITIGAGVNSYAKNAIDMSFSPNPFTEFTKIRYSLPTASKVDISLYDLLGSKITTLVNKEQQQGDQEVKLYRNDLNSGVYLLKLTTENNTIVRKIIISK